MISCKNYGSEFCSCFCNGINKKELELCPGLLEALNHDKNLLKIENSNLLKQEGKLNVK